jgi:hypothetical protein
MLKNSVLAAAMSAAIAMPMAQAADKKEQKELAEIRAEIRQMKQAYEARLQALEQKLTAAEADSAAAKAQLATLGAGSGGGAGAAAAAAGGTTAAATAVASPAAPAAAAADAPFVEAPAASAAAYPAAPSAPPAGSATAPSNLFNPNISMILGGTLQNLSQDPNQYRLQGFVPTGGEVGPGKRGFNLGESELTMAANIDPQFSGQLTFSLAGDNTVSVEEAFVQTRELSNGLNLKFGRFLSSIGYLNSQHAHTWDFVDAPLAYQAFLGGQYKPDGVQAKWLAPIDQFLELGMEVGSGSTFPGNDRNKNGAGSVAVFAHLGDDIGDATSYRAGVSYLHTGAEQRGFEDNGLEHAFSGKSATWIADAIYKWAPNGNPINTNFKLQGEYFRRKETGTLDYALATDAAASGNYRSAQSGWYLQSVYQFMPNWRTGLRYDRLHSGTPELGLSAAGLAILDPYNPARTSLMLDYSPSEFSRLRLQVARDKSRPGVSDNQIFLQYIMSLGTHAAHSF